MAVDQTGGVAACLTWSNNEKPSAGGQAQQLNDQRLMDGEAPTSRPDESSCQQRQVSNGSDNTTCLLFQVFSKQIVCKSLYRRLLEIEERHSI
jgi:hypothetical protein